MKKIILFLAIIILSLSLGLFIYLNINISLNVNNNEKVVAKINSIFPESDLEIFVDNEFRLPKLQINGTDYVGIINLLDNNVLLPVTSKCNSSLLNIQSACNYSSSPFAVLGTTLKDSFNSFSSYNVNDIVMFTNTLGQTFQFKMKGIRRLNSLNDYLRYDGDLMILIKDYSNMKYILVICDSY